MADELLPRNEEFGLAKSDQAKAPITDHERVQVLASNFLASG